MSDVNTLLARLDLDDPAEVREAARLAGEERVEAAIPKLAGLLSSPNLGVQEAAEFALRRIGGEATVGHLLPLLREDAADLRNLAMDVLREVGSGNLALVLDFLRDDDPDMRIFTADILGASKSITAVEPLCDCLLKDPEVNVRYQAAVSLGNLARSEASRCLSKAMSDQEWVQYAAIEALTKIRDHSSVDALIKALNSCSDLVASMIVEALGELGNIKAVAMLLRRMEMSPTALRNKIAKAVVRILGGKSLKLLSGAERDRFREYLLVALEDEDTEVQDAAALGLGYVGGEKATASLLRLVEALDPALDQERIARIVESLARIGANEALRDGLSPSVPWKRAMAAVQAVGLLRFPGASQLLMEAFPGRDRDLQRVIVSALYNVAGDEAVPFFEEILASHADGSVLKGAIAFLGEKLGRAESGPALFAMLTHPYEDVRETALAACVNIGDEWMVGSFTDWLRHENPELRSMAVHALGLMGSQESLIPLLIDLVADKDDRVRRMAVDSLSRFTNIDDTAREAIRSRLKDDSPEVRLAVVEAMGLCGRSECVPHLLVALGDSHDWVRIRAVEALGSLRAHEAVPRLVDLLSGSDKLVLLKVIENLGLIGGEAAFRSLLEVAGSDDPELAEAAGQAVAKMKSMAEDF